MKEGKKIYVDSLLIEEEYRECAKLYPNTYVNGNKRPEYFKSEFDWRTCRTFKEKNENA